MKNINKVVMVIMGTLVGAGFASGREIYLFFYQYGYLGLIGIVISSIITSLIIYIVLDIIQKRKIEHYGELLEKLNPKHQRMNLLFHYIVNSFMLISFFIMTAGFSAYMKQNYNIHTYISGTIFIILCYLVFQKNLQGMMKINSYLVPFLLFCIIFLGIKNMPYLIETKMTIEVPTKQAGFFISSMLYASYNSIVLIPILVSMKKYSKDSKSNLLIASLSGITMILLSFCTYGLLLKGQFFIKDLELPLLQITLEYGKIFYYTYSFVIIFSIFTSAIATGYSFLENVSKNQKSYQKNLILISIVAIFVSNIGFSNLVQTLYPLFGILGLLQIIFLFKTKL